MNALAKALDASISAAARVAPNIVRPAAWNASTMPSASASSGPTTVRSMQHGRGAKPTSAGNVRTHDRNIFRELRSAGIARRYKNFFHLRRLCQLPRERVLPAATADHQNVRAPGHVRPRLVQRVRPERWRASPPPYSRMVFPAPLPRSSPDPQTPSHARADRSDRRR